MDILDQPTVGLIGLIEYRANVYFEPVLPHITYQALTYLKTHNKFYENISIAKGLSSEKMLSFLTFLKFKEKMRMLLKKIFQMGRISESINDTETEYASVEDPFSCTELPQMRQLLFQI